MAAFPNRSLPAGLTRFGIRRSRRPSACSLRRAYARRVRWRRVAVDPLLYTSGLLIVSVLVLVVVVRRYNDRVADLRDEVAQLKTAKSSLSTTYGRITEQFAPFMESYPYESRNFRFLGSPIDGVQFEKDRIIFVEFKTNTSRLTADQQRYRDMVQQGRVEWLEFRLDAVASPASSPAAPEAGPAFTETGARLESD